MSVHSNDPLWISVLSCNHEYTWCVLRFDIPQLEVPFAMPVYNHICSLSVPPARGCNVNDSPMSLLISYPLTLNYVPTLFLSIAQTPNVCNAKWTS